jgi:hypothetical protein
MSWGFAEGQVVSAADEATYDAIFRAPGVTFVASTGDDGAADPEYPAFSPSVLAVGGTSLWLNADGSYRSETGWASESVSAGTPIASGSGVSRYEPEPAYQRGVQSAPGRTMPDVSLVADPATGVWIADPYNVRDGNPFEAAGGTSLSAPAWAGLLALLNQGRAAAGAPPLNSTGPMATQQALYSLPRADYHVINGGGDHSAPGAGDHLVTGLGTPVADRLVSDLVAFRGHRTSDAAPLVGLSPYPTRDRAGLGAGAPAGAFSVMDVLAMPASRLSYGPGDGARADSNPPPDGMPVMVGSSLTISTASMPSPGGSAAAPGWSANPGLASWTSSSPAGSATTPTARVRASGSAPWITSAFPARGQYGRPRLTAQSRVQPTPRLGSYSVQTDSAQVQEVGRYQGHGSLLRSARPRTGTVLDSVLDELAADLVEWCGPTGVEAVGGVAHPSAVVPGDPITTAPAPEQEGSRSPAGYKARLADLMAAAGLLGYGAGLFKARNRGLGNRPRKEGGAQR